MNWVELRLKTLERKFAVKSFFFFSPPWITHKHCYYDCISKKKKCTKTQLYLSSVSASPLVSSVTVPREQPPFLRLCLGLTDSDGWSELELSCSALACGSLLAFSWRAEEEEEAAAACPFIPAWGLAAGDSALAAASRLCLLMLFLRSLATFRAELFLFRGGGSLFPSSTPSPSERDRQRGVRRPVWLFLGKRKAVFDGHLGPGWCAEQADRKPDCRAGRTRWQPSSRPRSDGNDLERQERRPVRQTQRSHEDPNRQNRRILEIEILEKAAESVKFWGRRNIMWIQFKHLSDKLTDPWPLLIL